jgi:glyoxylase-like metal-dependent hydrolase (beta-lactamase superfamily II)
MKQITNGGWDQRITIFRADEAEAGEQVDAFAIVTQRYLVFIDTLATPALARQMVEAMRPHLADRQPLVINTHADYDHCWGNAVFATDGELPAPIYGHAYAAKRLTSDEDKRFLSEQQQKDPRFADVRLVPPTVTIDKQTTIDCGDLQLELIPTPGHCPDHIAIWVPSIRHLFTGDAAESPFPYVADAATLPLLIHSLEILAGLNAAIALPCHGETTSSELIIRNLSYFVVIKEHCQQSVESGTLPADWTNEQNIANIIGMTYERAIKATLTLLQERE